MFIKFTLAISLIFSVVNTALAQEECASVDYFLEKAEQVQNERPDKKPFFFHAESKKQDNGKMKYIVRIIFAGEQYGHFITWEDNMACPKAQAVRIPYTMITPLIPESEMKELLEWLKKQRGINA